ncbi:hypothetical protein [Marinicella litoralis]|nr:hypothetical protein [Marinicella litoralis]
MNPIENLLIRYRKHVQLSLLTYASLVSPLLVDQLYTWISVVLEA